MFHRLLEKCSWRWNGSERRTPRNRVLKVLHSFDDVVEPAVVLQQDVEEATDENGTVV